MKIYYILFIFLLIFIPLSVALDGNGTAVNPYIITECVHLGQIDTFDVNAYFALGNDINCTGEASISPQYVGKTASTACNINFDGRNFTITDMVIKGEATFDYITAFGYFLAWIPIYDASQNDNLPNSFKNVYFKNPVLNYTGSTNSVFFGLIIGMISDYGTNGIKIIFENIAVTNFTFVNITGHTFRTGTIFSGMHSTVVNITFKDILIKDTNGLLGATGGYLGGMIGSGDGNKGYLHNVYILGTGSTYSPFTEDMFGGLTERIPLENTFTSYYEPSVFTYEYYFNETKLTSREMKLPLASLYSDYDNETWDLHICQYHSLDIENIPQIPLGNTTISYPINGSTISYIYGDTLSMNITLEPTGTVCDCNVTVDSTPYYNFTVDSDILIPVNYSDFGLIQHNITTNCLAGTEIINYIFYTQGNISINITTPLNNSNHSINPGEFILFNITALSLQPTCTIYRNSVSQGTTSFIVGDNLYNFTPIHGENNVSINCSIYSYDSVNIDVCIASWTCINWSTECIADLYHCQAVNDSQGCNTTYPLLITDLTIPCTVSSSLSLETGVCPDDISSSLMFIIMIVIALALIVFTLMTRIGMFATFAGFMMIVLSWVMSGCYPLFGFIMGGFSIVLLIWSFFV